MPPLRVIRPSASAAPAQKVAGFARSPAAVLGAAVLSALAAGCSGRPEHVLTPITGRGGGATVDMLVMSTRAASPVPGEVYGGERAEDRSLTRIVVSIPPASARKAGEIQWPQRQPADPATDFATLKVEPMPATRVDRWFLDVAAKRRKVLIFVHGFNNSFEGAVYRFAQIVHDSGTDAAPILFSWPSRGWALEYLYDKESATNSRDALEALLARAASDPRVSDVTVLAHSMGNWIAIEALRQMAIRHGRVPEKIKNVIMASPDLDVDVFRSQYRQIGEPKPRFTLFLSQDDGALSLSRFLAGAKDRLGSIDPEQEPYRSKLDSTNIVVLDLTKLASNDGYHHGKFAESPDVVRLIGRRLIEGQSISSDDASSGERLIIPGSRNPAPRPEREGD